MAKNDQGGSGNKNTQTRDVQGQRVQPLCNYTQQHPTVTLHTPRGFGVLWILKA